MKKYSPKRKYWRDSDAHEKHALAHLDQDSIRTYPEINRAPAERAPLLHAAARRHPGKFELFRATARISRLLHDPNRRMATTINEVLRRLAAEPQKKPARRIDREQSMPGSVTAEYAANILPPQQGIEAAQVAGW